MPHLAQSAYLQCSRLAISETCPPGEGMIFTVRWSRIFWETHRERRCRTEASRNRRGWLAAMAAPSAPPDDYQATRAATVTARVMGPTQLQMTPLGTPDLEIMPTILHGEGLERRRWRMTRT